MVIDQLKTMQRTKRCTTIPVLPILLSSDAAEHSTYNNT